MSKLIFFVDDDKMIINLLEYTFDSRQQYLVRSFQSGEECIESLDMNPDLVVLDHQLSGVNESKMDGVETLRKIRKIKPDLPVVVLTAYGTEELYNEFAKLGAKHFLTKDDYFINLLIDTIEGVLDQK